MKVFFDRTSPFYIVEEDSFHAVPVEIDEVVVVNIRSLRQLFLTMDEAVDAAGAPEDTAQELTDIFVAEVRKIFKTRKQENRSGF